MRIKDWKLLTFFSVLFICTVFFYCLDDMLGNNAVKIPELMAQYNGRTEYFLPIGTYLPGIYTTAYTVNVQHEPFMSQYALLDYIQPLADDLHIGWAIRSPTSQLQTLFPTGWTIGYPGSDKYVEDQLESYVGTETAVHPSMLDTIRSPASLERQSPNNGLNMLHPLVISGRAGTRSYQLIGHREAYNFGYNSTPWAGFRIVQPGIILPFAPSSREYQDEEKDKVAGGVIGGGPGSMGWGMGGPAGAMVGAGAFGGGAVGAFGAGDPNFRGVGGGPGWAWPGFPGWPAVNSSYNQ